MNELNEAQQQAVESGDGPQLILAGAGSGKTRTIIHRIGYLIANRGLAPHRILAVTFTNKAAAELKARLSILIGDGGGGVESGTFHALSLKFLRRYADALGYPRTFQVIDADDQKALVKRLLKARNITTDRLHPNYLLGWIEQCKHAGMTPEQASEHGWNGVDMRELYGEYQAYLKQHERMDFSDLILNVVLLMREFPDIAEALRSRFDSVLVDEYQDTNPIQHEWLMLLCSGHRNLTVVGDDDQSIYGWRGADVSHILGFEQTWRDASVHRLEENYRSTGAILELANAVIRENSDRHEKVLKTTLEQGELPRWLVCNDDYDEARRIAGQLEHWRSQGYPWHEMAILFRSNRQSLALEQVLRELQVPYRMIGGVGFFERMEIKDALAYWSLLNGCGDALQLLRICNRPKRGLGAKGQEQLMTQLADSGMRASEWLQFIAASTPTGAASKVVPVAALMLSMQEKLSEVPDRGLMHLLEESGYLKSIEALGEIESASRLENIKTLQEYIELSMAEGIAPVEFMDRAALLQSSEEMQESEEDASQAVSMMSLHRAKGLEFDCVALPGVEEGQLPHQRATDEGERGISEERRLLYVGITRARKHLILTSARVRRLFGESHYPLPSRFIKQLSTEILAQDGVTAPSQPATGTAGHMVPVGGNVSHPSFGEGVVLSLEGVGDAARVTVQFRRAGVKKLMMKYAALQMV